MTDQEKARQNLERRGLWKNPPRLAKARQAEPELDFFDVPSLRDSSTAGGAKVRSFYLRARERRPSEDERKDPPRAARLAAVTWSDGDAGTLADAAVYTASEVQLRHSTVRAYFTAAVIALFASACARTGVLSEGGGDAFLADHLDAGGGADSSLSVSDASASFDAEAGPDVSSVAGEDAGQPDGCTPVDCAQANLLCGALDDHCGKVIDCGPCAPPASCGGGGIAGRCGCTPTCDGFHCGTVDDGCGGTMDCGCSDGLRCGGDGLPGFCGGSKVCTNDGWCWEHPLPFGWGILSYWGVAANDLWAAAGPKLLHWDGKRWATAAVPPLDPNSVQSFMAVHGISSTDVWAAGVGRTLAHWDGTAWSLVPVPVEYSNSYYEQIWQAGPDDLWLLSNSSPPVRRTAGTWTQYAVAGHQYEGLWGLSETSVWTSSNIGLFHWDGSSFAPVQLPVSSNSAYSIWGTDENNLWLGNSSGLLHWNGTDWTSNSTWPIDRITGTTAADVWATSDVSILHWDGSDWAMSEQPGFAPSGLAAFPSVVWAGGAHGANAVFDGRWTVNESSVGWPEINGVWWGGEDNAWLVADDETVGRWDGNAWVKVEGPNTGVNYLQKVWAESPNNVWIVAGGVDYPGAIAHWDGTAWTVPVHTGGGLRHMWAGSASNIWAAGDGGELQHYDGVSWSPVAHDAQGNLTGLWGYGNEVWATSSQGDLLHWDGSEMNVTHSLAQTLVSVGGSSPTDLWVASDRTVGRWDGSSWTWTPLPSSARAVFSLCVEEPGKPWVGTYGELLHLDTGGWVTSGADLPSFGSRPGRVFCQGPGAVRAILGAGGRWAVVRYDP